MLDKLPSFYKVLGLCVVAASVVAPTLLLKHERHESDDHNWSSRARLSVASGTVRQQPQAKLALPNNEAHEAERSAEAPVPSEPSHDPVNHPISAPSGKENLRHTIQKSLSKTQPKAGDTTRGEAKPENVIAQKHRAPTSETLTASEQVRAPEKSALELPDTAMSSTTHPAIDAPTKSALENREQPQQIDESSSRRPPKVATDDTAVDHQVEPRPKTRKQVEDELRKARLNGSLPRFGNPDPYGPGGSPNTSDN